MPMVNTVSGSFARLVEGDRWKLGPNGVPATYLLLEISLGGFEPGVYFRNVHLRLQINHRRQRRQHEDEQPNGPSPTIEISAPNIPNDHNDVHMARFQTYGSAFNHTGTVWSWESSKNGRLFRLSSMTAAVLIRQINDHEDFEVEISVRAKTKHGLVKKVALEPVAVSAEAHLERGQIDDYSAASFWERGQADDTLMHTLEKRVAKQNPEGWQVETVVSQFPSPRKQLRRWLVGFLLKGGRVGSRLRIRVGLIVLVLQTGLEGFGGGMLAFAALAPNIDSVAARWGIGVPAFASIVASAIFDIIPLLDPGKQEGVRDVVEEINEAFEEVGFVQGIEILAEDRTDLVLHVESAGDTLLEVLGCITAVLWNLAAGNGLVQNGYIGLISAVTAGTSMALSWWCYEYSCQKSDKLNAVPMESIRAYKKTFRYLIIAPILVGIVCALGSVLGAAYLFGISDDAESVANQEAEYVDYLFGQVFPAAVNFVLVARNLGKLPHLVFRWGLAETGVLLICQLRRKLSATLSQTK